MIGCFPTLYPDELVYSASARFSERMEFPNKGIAVLELFNSPNAKAVVDLPCHLGNLSKMLPPGHDYRVERLIDNHTLLPLYAPFLPANRVRALREDMALGSGQRIHTRAGIKASRVSYPEYLRFCARCAHEDRSQYGETYWHRIHQVPGVLLCPLDGCLLQSSSAPFQPRARFAFVVAEQVVPAGQRVGAPGATPLQVEVMAHKGKLLSIAHDAAWLLSNPQAASGSQSIRSRYIQVLQELNLALDSGRVHIQKLVTALCNYYTPALLEWLNCGLKYSSSGSWLGQLVRKGDIAQHPLYHLLLIQFLGYSAPDFFRIPIAEQADTMPDARRAVVPPGDTRKEHRARWLRLRKQSPAVGVAALRRECPALYLWLYRNDRTWLLQHKPQSRRGRNRPGVQPPIVDWHERDTLLMAKVKAAATYIGAISNRPVRITVAAISREIGSSYTPLLRSFLDKLPQTATLLGQVVETREESAIRRVRIVTEHYRGEGVIPKRWQLVKRAGVYRLLSDNSVREEIEKALSNLEQGRVVRDMRAA